ncbi:uncharacterized protein LOC109792469 [Cajanus cajan]|uniref:uncharacterized protein LOC109792469 n=1 Tax=Cajanus cajan TaxID=3821 RepID=UPI00098DA87F|nr:uncharacterized protein LOC109792469 [Cajanus cajan]
MIAWSVELSEFGIQYESRGALKAQCLADFVAELTPTSVEETQSLKFGFKVTNNQAEYKALLAGLRLARDLGARKVSCNSDSKLMVEQLSGAYQTKDTLLQRYFHLATQRISSFDELKMHHVPREQNARADLLSKLASIKRPGQHRTIIQETLHSPSLDDKVVCTGDSKEQGWTTGIWNYLKAGVLPEDKDEARKMRVKSAKFVIVGDELFKHGISTPLLKCLTTPQAAFGIPHSLITDNGMQFIAQSFDDFLRELGIKHLPTSVEHPQTNGQAEAANKVILRELKKRLGNAKGQWADELPSILWAYHCTP